jgi:hypothetical protein
MRNTLLALIASLGVLTACNGSGGTASPFIAIPMPSPSSTPGPLGVATSTIQFTAIGQSQDVAITDAGYAGTYTAQSSAATVATSAIAAGAVHIVAAGAGTTTVTVGDSFGHRATIAVGVTTSGVVVSIAH